MNYIYEKINWTSERRVDTFTRFEELNDISFDDHFIIIYKGDNPTKEIGRIMNEDMRDAWVTARERDQWKPEKPKKEWDPFADTDIQVQIATKEELAGDYSMGHYRFIIGYLAHVIQMKKHGKSDPEAIERWLNQL